MRNSASLAYFLTMSIFPLLLCAVAILGSLDLSQFELAAVFEGIIPDAAIVLIDDFMAYVTGNLSTFMLILGIATMVTTSASALRIIMGVIGDIQGEKRFHGMLGHLISFLISIGLLVAVYLSGFVIITGEWFHGLLEDLFPARDMSFAWLWIRFIVLFAIMFSVLLVIYMLAAPKKTRVKERLVGALAAGVLMVAVSAIFSKIISESARYTVVYGSLASIIVLMVWMYALSIIIIVCNVLNVALARSKTPQRAEKCRDEGIREE